jgi:hypothetical protein
VIGLADAGDVSGLAVEVRERISRFRNDFVVHLPHTDRNAVEPGGRFTIVFNARMDEAWIAYSRNVSEVGLRLLEQSERPRALVSLVQDYLSAVLDLLERNLDKALMPPVDQI